MTNRKGNRVDRGEGLTIIEVTNPEYWLPKLRGTKIEAGGAVYTFVRVLQGNRILVRRLEKPS